MVDREAYICAALRTPVGKHGWALAQVRADDLAAIPIKAVVERTGLDPRAIDDVILGCTNQAGEDNRNVARMALLRAGLPVDVPGQTVNRRAGMRVAAGARHRPAFEHGGAVPAASSSGITDGAAALLVAGRSDGRAARRKPLARIVATAVAGVDPSCMGLGPIPATQKVLGRAGLKIDQIDLVELNEAFAAQAIACIRELKLDPVRVNLYGGAIALGHPLGATGARVRTTLLDALRRTKARYGLATLRIGVGQGIALIVERS